MAIKRCAERDVERNAKRQRTDNNDLPQLQPVAPVDNAQFRLLDLPVELVLVIVELATIVSTKERAIKVRRVVRGSQLLQAHCH